MSPLAALGVGAAGLTGTVAGTFAQAADAGTEVTPWATGGGIATLAGVLIYFFKQMVAGELVSKKMAERLQEAQVVNAASMAREDRLQEVILESRRREAAYARKMEDANRALYQVAEALKGNQR